jgi:FkbM family methyltransferase
MRRLLQRDPNRFLQKVSGVIHVGANTGQERDLYQKHGLRVIWIEPIPEVFAALEANLEHFHGQRAVEGLVTDRDDAEYQFHVANNNGASSSILDLKEHKDIWPTVAYTKTIPLKSVTLASLLQRERLDPADYDALIMDAQGSELLVLKGAGPVLHNFKYIKTEVPDFESYAGCCQLIDIESFLTGRGYEEFARRRFATRAGGGSYYDIVYRRTRGAHATRQGSATEQTASGPPRWRGRARPRRQTFSVFRYATPLTVTSQACSTK